MMNKGYILSQWKEQDNGLHYDNYIQDYEEAWEAWRHLDGFASFCKGLHVALIDATTGEILADNEL